MKRFCHNVHCSFEAMSRIALDYSYILLLRNMTNHASDTVLGNEGWIRTLNRQYHYKLPEETSAEDVKEAIRRGLENMNVKKNMPVTTTAKKKGKG